MSVGWKALLLALASAALLALPASGGAAASKGCWGIPVRCRSWAPQGGGHKYGLYLTMGRRLKETEDGGKHWRVVFAWAEERLGNYDCGNDEVPQIRSFNRTSRTTAQLVYQLRCAPAIFVYAETTTANWGCPTWTISSSDGAFESGSTGSRTAPRCRWAL